MRRFTINVTIPPSWEEIPGDSHAYRRIGVTGGVLRISLHPPIAAARVDAEEVPIHLKALLLKLGLDVCEELHSHVEMSALGVVATSLRKSKESGILQFWIIAGQVTLFISYIMGDLSEVEHDLGDAQSIVAGIQLERVS